MASSRTVGILDAMSNKSFWAVTTYFNPLHYRRRRTNYYAFRTALRIPLLTVELGYDNRFELGPNDADRLVQISGTDLLWQKERLLNLALDHFTLEASIITWLDCD